jgi:hypothetical protein
MSERRDLLRHSVAAIELKQVRLEATENATPAPTVIINAVPLFLTGRQNDQDELKSCSF